MHSLLKIALRNLLRYKRRTVLTVSLIVIGLVFVLVFISVSGSFKQMIIGQITDSMMGHIQIHKKGYVASIDNLPLDVNLSSKSLAKLKEVLSREKSILCYSERIKFGGMLSNYSETTNIRLNGIKPEQEFQTVPLLTSRIIEGKKSLKRGEILVPILLAKGMNLKIGTPVVVVTTNKDGSVNGKTLMVAGVLENVIGPMGRDGYIHYDDAADLLRMEQSEASEVVLRLRDYDQLHRVEKELAQILSQELMKNGKPVFEVHAWDKLHPFGNIAGMIDMMTFFTTLMLVAIVLISILNVMTMAVYERMKEIGTIIALGTLPGKIAQLFLVEGLSMGVVGVLAGNVISLILLAVIKHLKITFPFLRDEFILAPRVNPLDFLIASLIVIFISTLATLQPALKASRLDPVKTFRQM